MVEKDSGPLPSSSTGKLSEAERDPRIHAVTLTHKAGG